MPAPCICELLTHGAPVFPLLNTLWHGNLRTLTEGDLDPSWILFQVVGHRQFGGLIDQPSWFCPSIWRLAKSRRAAEGCCHVQMNVFRPNCLIRSGAAHSEVISTAPLSRNTAPDLSQWSSTGVLFIIGSAKLAEVTGSEGSILKL